MKSLLLSVLALFFCTALTAQKIPATSLNPESSNTGNDNQVTANIYPVPVKDGKITIETSKEISEIRISNIIGQEIYKSVFNTPEKEARINLNNVNRGIYVIVITFSDNKRIVKKISSEGPSS